MKKIYLLLTVLLTQFNSFAQCIEKRISPKNTQTFYLNSKNQPTKIQIIEKGKTTNTLLSYDPNGKLTSANFDKSKQIKFYYNTGNQLISTELVIEKNLKISNKFEYQNNRIESITTSMGMANQPLENVIETKFLFDNDNITKIWIKDIQRDTLHTVISQASYDNADVKQFNEEKLLNLAAYNGFGGFENLLILSKNNPLKFISQNFNGEEDCMKNPNLVEFTYKYDANNKIIEDTRKEACDDKITTITTKIQRICK